MHCIVSNVITHAHGCRVGSVFIVICLLFTRQVKPNAARITKLDRQMFHDESWKTHSFSGQEVKDQGHNVCVGLQTESNVAAAAYVSYAGFSLLWCPAAQLILATPGFPCVTSRRPFAAGRWVFPAWIFAFLWVLASSCCHLLTLMNSFHKLNEIVTRPYFFYFINVFLH